MDYKLTRLASYDDTSLLEEVKRVSDIVGGETLTVSEFKKHARVNITTLRNRFGSWENALKEAGIAEKYVDGNRKRNKDELIEELKRVSAKTKAKTLTVRQFQVSSELTVGPYLREFGSWLNALKEAGLEPAEMGKRYSDEECFENLLTVWAYYGRAPKHKEMSLPPSVVGPKGYVGRWGTWTKALYAFVERVETDPDEQPSGEEPKKESIPDSEVVPKCDKRDISLSLRYKVLVRDKFRCKICGRSPATDIGIILHVDHIYPWSKGGPTSIENLRTLCNKCNLGKGAEIEDEI